jgi:hypothetical protein
MVGGLGARSGMEQRMPPPPSSREIVLQLSVGLGVQDSIKDGLSVGETRQWFGLGIGLTCRMASASAAKSWSAATSQAVWDYYGRPRHHIADWKSCNHGVTLGARDEAEDSLGLRRRQRDSQLLVR